jgi:hypothetical protein
MKLKDIIEKLNENLIGSPISDLKTRIENLWPELTRGRHFEAQGPLVSFIYILNAFLEEKFLSKNEGQFWMKSINCEFQELRNRIEILEKQLKKKLD